MFLAAIEAVADAIVGARFTGAVCAAGALALADVTVSSPMRLSEFPMPALRVGVLQAERQVTVGINPRQDDVMPRSPCKRPAPTVRATVNGVALKRLTGKRATDDRSYDHDCFVDFASIAGTLGKADGRATLRVEDGSATWTFEMPDAFVARAVTLVSPANGVIRRGQEVVLRWSPASDQMRGADIGFALYGSDRSLEKWIDLGKVNVRAGGRLGVTIPTTVPRDLNGPVWLQFRGTSNVHPSFGSCPARTCTASVTFTVPPVAVRLED